jgi:hypothetical protein
VEVVVLVVMLNLLKLQHQELIRLELLELLELLEMLAVLEAQPPLVLLERKLALLEAVVVAHQTLQLLALVLVVQGEPQPQELLKLLVKQVIQV